MSGLKPRIRVWCIGAEKTEYYAAYSEEDLRQFYIEMVGSKQAEDDFAACFEEVPEPELDRVFELAEEGTHVKTTWLKLIGLHESFPALIRTGDNFSSESNS
ncbi:MAG: hypothetical protein P4L03_09020 [Terracidiphilus sp.]|nr:hypothetical protein [Terracidiphilus sp.]